VIYADSRAMLHDRIFSLRKANIYERHSYRHIIGMPVMLRQDGGRAEAETPFLVVRTMRDGTVDVLAVGRYADVLRPDDDGTLRFVERLAICDSPRFDTLLAIPL
jgi:3-phenylpropionate/cinnamic acid dioxygenase small subunit